MSESSEVDEIGRETGRAARRAGEAVAQIVDRAKRANPKAKRLGWKDRREARKTVSRILREERELERLELEQQRRDLTEDIHAHHTAVWHGHQVRPSEPMQEWYGRQQNLTRSRMAIEKRIITAGGLSNTQRGQAVRALRQAHYLPAYQLPKKVFARSTGVAALRDRMQTRLARWRATPLSERQLQQRAWEAGWNAAQLRAAQHSEARRQQNLAEQQGHRLHEMREAPAQPTQERATPQPTPKTAVSARSAATSQQAEQAGPPWETNWLQADAVQDLRRAELGWLRFDRDPFSPVPLDQVRTEVRNAVDSARAAGLSEDRIDWELANVETNSRARTTLSYRSPTDPRSVDRILGYHPTEAEAAEWAHDTLTASEWDQGTKFAVVGREAGRAEPYLKLSGDETEVRTGVQQWRAELTEQAQQHETPADPARNLRANSVHLDGEQVVAHTTGARVTHPTGGVGTHSHVMAANIGGQVNGDNTLMTRTREQQLQARVAGLEKKLDTLTAEAAAEVRDDPESLDALRSALTDVAAERDKFRQERDEAVVKLVQATPRAQRYGSPQRQAAFSVNGQGTATALLDKEQQPTAAQESRNQELIEAANQDAHEDYLASLEEEDALAFEEAEDEEPVIELTEDED